MILNAYAILDAFLALLRLGLGVAVVWLAVGCLRRLRAPSPEARDALEDRTHLLSLLAGLSLVANALSWPVTYLTLQSYVAEWPGLTCVYGVTRVGSGSLSASRFLPPLLAALQASKPALVFLSGAWLTLYVIDRRTRTAPLAARVVASALAAGLLACFDAGAELLYLVLPKKEVFLSSGCCADAFGGGAERFLPKSLFGASGEAWLYVAFFAANAGMTLVLGWHARRPAPRRLPFIIVAALLCLAINAVFLADVAAPILLHKPGHHCVYDLPPDAPLSLAAIAPGVAAALCAGWGCVAGWLGRVAETTPTAEALAGTLFRAALCGHAFGVVVLTLQLALA